MSPWLVLNNMLVLFCFVCGRGRDACDRSCRISWMYRQKSNRNTFFPGSSSSFTAHTHFLRQCRNYLMIGFWSPSLRHRWVAHNFRILRALCALCEWICSTESHRVVDEFMRRWHCCLCCVLTGPGGVHPAVNQPTQCWPRVLHGSLDWCLLPAQISGGNSHHLLQCEPLCIF